MGRRVGVAWAEGADGLYARYTGERDVARRWRLQALWLVRSGASVAEVGRSAGVGRRSVERWLGWYRRGGLAEALRRLWLWLERFRQEQLKPVLAEWGLDAVVWDGAGAHRGKRLEELPTERIFLPPYSPELNPAEHVLEEIRRRVEGRVYDSLDPNRLRSTPTSRSWRPIPRGSGAYAAGPGSSTPSSPRQWTPPRVVPR